MGVAVSGRSRPGARAAVLAATALCAAWGAAVAFYDPTLEYTETPAVAARFPDPSTPLATPGFKANRVDFTQQADLMKFLEELARRAPDMRMHLAGRSIEDRAIPLLVFAHPPAGNGAALAANGKPTVLVIGGQHGNEPAGGEAALALAQGLAGETRALLDRINVLIVPRANPDGAQHWKRGLVNGGDVDRDHLLQATPEGRTLGRIFAEYEPAVVVYSHEFGVKLRWFEKFGALQRYDVMFQFATAPNLPPALAAASATLFRDPLERALDAAGLTHSLSYTTSYDMSDLTVSMGSVMPDTGRNVAGLRNAISILVESRGVGIARAHFRRRVETHRVATRAILEVTARHAAEIASLVRRAREDVAAAAGQGDVVVAGAPTSSRQTLVMLDPETGADKPVEVDIASALAVRPLRTRARPYGYLLPASQTTAARRLANLGVTVKRVESDTTLEVERYRIVRAAVARKNDSRRNDEEPSIRAVDLELAIERASIPVHAGDLYVPLDQPLGNVIVAALEPDSQSSYAANYVLTFPGPRDPERTVPAYRLTAPLNAPTAPWDPP
jgi:hypothetical protein